MKLLKLLCVLGIFIGLFAFSMSKAFSVTPSQLHSIYSKIAKANGLSVPRLVIVPYIFYPGDVNAQSRWHKITVSQNMVRYYNTNEIAIVLGHELAHYKLWHMRSTWANEFAADKLGFQYTVRAGFNGCLGARKILIYKQSNDHPSGRERYNRLCGRR